MAAGNHLSISHCFLNLNLNQILVKAILVSIFIKTLFIYFISYLKSKKHLTGVRKTMTNLPVGPIVSINLLMRFNSLH